ncbi:hypothetical protein ABZ464_21315 [Streptomyces sp. NPDC005820]|uniref:hypothetical protein n=1 Tax=Streptomyces sp. NPDC005820 TaxID=3157069 RepID=UPI0034038B8D
MSNTPAMIRQLGRPPDAAARRLGGEGRFAVDVHGVLHHGCADRRTVCVAHGLHSGMVEGGHARPER